METRKIKSQVLLREATIDLVERAAGSNGEQLREVKLSLSSETPVDQWFGREILSHDPGAVRLKRMNNGAPLLLNHNSDRQIGAFVRGTVRIGEDKKLRGSARFSRSEHAQEIANDVEDDIRTSTSVGYRVYAMERARELEELDEKGNPLMLVYRVTDWEPVEASIVPVPADPTVGKGRMLETENEIIITDPGDPGDPDAAMEGRRSMEPTPTQGAPAAAAPPVNLEVIRAEAADSERKRIADIDAVAAKFNLKPEFVREHKEKGTPAQAFAHLVVNNWSPEMIRTMDMSIGLNPNQVKQFSICRAAAAILKGDWAEAGFEREVTTEARKKQLLATGKDHGPKSFTVPWEVQMSMGRGKRDLLAASGEGPELVGTQLVASEFIELLRPFSVCVQAGARVLTGLVGNQNFPRMTAGGATGWVTEGSAVAEVTPTLDVLALSPKTAGAFTDVTRQLLMQSTPAAESVVRDDLSLSLGTTIDVGGLRGTGSAGQPTGIAATSGIGSVAFGTNGAAPTNALMVEFLTDVANANAFKGNLAWAVNPNTFGKLMTTEKASSTAVFMWNDNAPGRPLYGFPAHMSTNLRNTLVKGTSGAVCSEIIFGNWLELFLAFWGGLDIVVDPYTASTTGTVRIVALQSCDVGLRHAGSFSYAADVLTT